MDFHNMPIVGILNGLDFPLDSYLPSKPDDINPIDGIKVPPIQEPNGQTDGCIFSSSAMVANPDDLEWSDVFNEDMESVFDPNNIQSIFNSFNNESNGTESSLDFDGSFLDFLETPISDKDDESTESPSVTCSSFLDSSSASLSSPVEKQEIKPTTLELVSGLTEEERIRIEIIRDDGTEIVVEAVRIEDAEEEASIANHDVVVKDENHTQVKTEVSNVDVRRHNTRTRGGRPIVFPRIPDLNSCQNSRKRKREEVNTVAIQVSQLENIYCELYQGHLDDIYKSLDLEAEDEPKSPRAPKRPRAEDEDLKLDRKRVQNRSQTKKYREKMKRKESNNKKKWNKLVEVVGAKDVAPLLKIGIKISAKFTCM